MLWEELGISVGTAVIVLAALYFVVKWAVRTAIQESKGEIAKAVEKGLQRYRQEKPGASTEEDGSPL